MKVRHLDLLLVELEDLNPYLSLLELSEETSQNFVEVMKKSLQKAIQVLIFTVLIELILANISSFVIPLEGEIVQ